jgi:ATP-dependent exoDNAse (exonuclease V) beta subunit
VICPFCDWQLEKTGNVLWCRPTEAPFNDLPIAPIDYSQKHMMGTIYESDYLQEHLQNTVDNLNLLYVAFTRACKSLTVIGKRGAKSTRSALIEQCLPQVAKSLPEATLEGLQDEKGELHFSYGEINIKPEVVDLFHQPTTNPFLQPSAPVGVKVETFESKVDFKQSNRSKAFLEGDDEENQQHRNYIQTGSILHEVFSTIRTTADIPEALQRLQFEGVLYDEQITAERITTMLKKRLEDKRVSDWFSPRWTLFNECSILSMEEGEVKERRPDRVMTDGNEWIVVDFKFGAPKPEYHDQVREYMQLLASMGHQNIKGYLWYVYKNEILKIED